MAIGIFYGSNTGATREVAEQIKKELGLEATLHDIALTELSAFDDYTQVIIGTSTWGDGDLQDDWDEKFDDFADVDFTAKTVAFFGLGDQELHGDYFLDGMAQLHAVVVKNGATIVGNGWSTDGYDFGDSEAIVDDTFVGLAIDVDNEEDLTEARVKKWVSGIKAEFS